MTQSAHPLDGVEPTTAIVIGPSAPDSFADNIAAGLREAGVSAAVIDPHAGFTGSGNLRAYSRYGAVMREAITRSKRVNAALVDRPMQRALENHDPLLVICAYAYLTPQQVERLRRLTPRARWVLWYPDSLANLAGHQCFLAPYDHLFFKEPYLVDLLSSRTSLPVHYLAQGCNPDRHRTEEPESAQEGRRYACDVVVAGNLYPYRLLVLTELPDGLDLKVYGNHRRGVPPGFERIGAAHTGTFVSGRSKALAFRGAKIVLNTMHYSELQGVNSRLFEATACGGFVLSHDSPGLSRYFEDGRELTTFNGGEELRERVRHYLDHDDERDAVAVAGQARSHRDHTYRARLARLVTVAGLADNTEMGALASDP